MPYMTPLQRATESSTMPKSVMKTTVGGGCAAVCCARAGLAKESKKAVAATSDKIVGHDVRADCSLRVHGIFIFWIVIRINTHSPWKDYYFTGDCEKRKLRLLFAKPGTDSMELTIVSVRRP